MGLFTSIFGGVAATSAANRLNPPTVIMRDVNFVCKGLSPKRLYKWAIAYGPRNSREIHWLKLNDKVEFIDEVGGIDIYWN